MAKKGKGSGFGKQNGSRKITKNVHYNFWGMVASVLMRFVDRGQAPLVVVMGIAGLIIYRLPAELLADLVVRFLEALERKSLYGYISSVVLICGWFLHAKWQRRILSAEMHRMGREKSRLQERASGVNLDSSLSK